MTINQLTDLQQQFSDKPTVQFEQCNELIALQVNNAVAKATIFCQGAQISLYQPHQSAAVLWTSPACDYSAGKSLRGGIPICWPWFSGLADNPKTVTEQYSTEQLAAAPPHGIVRELDWQLAEINEHENVTELVWFLDLAKDSSTYWPYKTSLSYRVSIGKELNIEFNVCNNGVDKFHFSTALHSYLAVDNIDNAVISGLDGCDYVDALDERKLHRQQGGIRFTGETDRIYRGCNTDITLTEEGSDNDSLVISSSNSDSAVIWNPWIEKSKTLSHFADDAYQSMLCIETANADKDFVTLEPGHSHCLTVTLARR
ncbi:Putative glucose-6-phosphate 1-epimerase [Sinobacterium norvegicum]|uniref:Putative glucose-6-phosphate 1-epimerase n=1 Tax=Sinobacterium norvegicum TaxID=1641715 RepID=A0ABN8EJR2_9GAMM|nr:D-hexose-6-phosphate mutarotase [Sinobacterium norvegicum]CAH0991617.1 Putative glucose-6-phosphate 1-epimerase [Sinobacterium norvegicum]